MIPRIVTLQEANGLLPLVQEHFFRIHYAISKLSQIKRAIPEKSFRNQVIDKNRTSIKLIGDRTLEEIFCQKAEEAKRLENLLVRELHLLIKLGAQIKGLVPAHIDFLSIKNNEPICLCWYGGEKEIKHWHHLDHDSPLRQIINEKNHFGPEMVH